MAQALRWLSICLLLAAASRAQAQPTYAQRDAKDGAERSTWLQASLGYLLPVPHANRHDQGVDLGLAYGWRKSIWRLGGEARYTFAGGFDASQPTYRFDIGALGAVEPFTSRYVALQLGVRGMFSRAGTYRRSDVPVERSGPTGPTTETVSFVAWYGITASFDVTLLFPFCFVRVSGMHTSWYWSHERDSPWMEHWSHFSVGYAF